ncbi:MAG: hypothetical protein AABX11_02650 [Nanoarchaeota archaeon]
MENTNKPSKIVDIIWNMSLVCPWDCSNCCVDAVNVVFNQNRIVLRSNNLQETEHISQKKRTISL